MIFKPADLHDVLNTSYDEKTISLFDELAKDMNEEERENVIALCEAIYKEGFEDGIELLMKAKNRM